MFVENEHVKEIANEFVSVACVLQWIHDETAREYTKPKPKPEENATRRC
jgi:hypothetical protein